MFSAAPVPGKGGSGAKSDRTFSFGKHNGRTFEEVAASDTSYCQWALSLPDTKGAMKAFVDYLRANGVGKGQEGGASSGEPPNLMARRPSAAGGFGSGAPKPPARVLGLPAGPRLGDDTLLVCGLVQDQRFLVRAEKVGGASHRDRFSKSLDDSIARARGYMPPHVWNTLAGFPGAQMNSSRSGWLFPLSSYDEIVASLDELGNVDRIPDWVLSMVRKAQGAKVDEKLNDSRVPEKLLPYQLEGLRYGVSRSGRCLIGDEMGLGKTLQALALAAQYAEDLPVLVVCPSSLRWVWKEQAQQWLPDLMPSSKVQVVRKGTDKLDPAAKMWIISYNMLASGLKHGNFEKRPDGTPHAMIIADESHNIKEWKAARTKALIPLLRAARRAMLLSGTPTRNSAEELHPQLCGLIPSMPANYSAFRSRYCIQQQSMIPGGRTVSKVVGARNAEELNYLLTSTVMVRRLKKEVLTQLPEKRRQRVPVEVAKSGEELRVIRNKMQSISAAMIAGDNEAGEAYSTLFRKLAQAKLPAVKEYLEDVLERGDEKVIVFAHHQVMMDELSECLSKNLAKEGLTHVRIDGRTPQGKRQEFVKKFQEDLTCRVALLSITACGEGISLTAAGLVIFAELYWVPGAVEQAEARAHRLGSQHSRVVVEYLVVPNSPDEHIYSCLDRKAKDTSHMLNGAAESLNAAEERPTPPSRKRERAAAAPAATPEGEVKRQRGRPRADEARKEPPTEAAKQAGPTPAEGPAPAEPAPAAVARSKVEFLLRAARAGASMA